jgi:hypothetical protein
MTVKRRMAGRGLTVRMLQELCAVANLTLTELVALAEVEGPADQEMATPEQADQVAEDVLSGTIFFLLESGWRPERIARELHLDEATMTGRLARLDRIGVIALFPGNRVRLRRRMGKDIRRYAGVMALVARRVHQFFDRPDLDDPAMAWTSGISRLSPASFAQLRQKLEELRDAAFALGEHDLALPSEAVSWYWLFAGARPVPVEQLLYEELAAGSGAAAASPRSGVS